MKKNLSWIRKLQKKAIESAETIAEKASESLNDAKIALKQLDDRHDITHKMGEMGKRIEAHAQNADRQYEISSKAGVAKQVATAAAAQVKDKVIQMSRDTGLNKRVKDAGEALKTRVATPASDMAKSFGLDRATVAAGEKLEHCYGALRSVIKPYFLAETSDELLRKTKGELAYITACIMQISVGEAEKVAGQFGAVIASKIAGIATTASLLTLVASYGTASTGAAIASLSGAAASNATLAWVGSLLGGGMATGAVLTGGLTIVVGLSAYKLLSSDRRAFESLSEPEQRIVQTCWYLIAIIDELLANDGCTFNQDVASGLLNNTLLPLQAILVAQTDTICANLDRKNAVAFRQHVLIDFKRVVVDGFRHFMGYESNSIAGAACALRTPSEYVIGGVIYALLTRTVVDCSVESQLVLTALRRSDSDLETATESELSDYLDNYDAEQLKGIANNIKGIYHEELWVHRYNETHQGTYAELFGATNHAGADIQIRDANTHEVLDEVQLKATESMSYVNEHLERYPDIHVRVTNELAEKMDVTASGIDNSEITERVNSDLDLIADSTAGDRALNSAELATAIATGQELIAMLKGEKAFPEAIADVATKAGSAGAATFIAAYLFS